MAESLATGRRIALRCGGHCHAQGLIGGHLYGVEAVVVDAAGRTRTVLAPRASDAPLGRGRARGSGPVLRAARGQATVNPPSTGRIVPVT